jgi:hypothetical protein
LQAALSDDPEADAKMGVALPKITGKVLVCEIAAIVPAAVVVDSGYLATVVDGLGGYVIGTPHGNGAEGER